MKIKIISVSLLGLLSYMSFGQWTNTPTETYLTNLNGNVGIGIATPVQFKLTLPGSYSNISLGNNIFINGQGSTGRISNNSYLSSTGSWTIFDAGAKAVTIELRDNGVIDMYGTTTNGQSNWKQMFGLDAPNNKVVFPNGNVGIGTYDPKAFLDVAADVSNGKIGTIFGRLPEGGGSGDGTYLGVKGYGTQISQYSGKSFSIEHSFYGQINSSINFYRGNTETGGYISFGVNNNSEQFRVNQNGSEALNQLAITPKNPVGNQGGKLFINDFDQTNSNPVDKTWSIDNFNHFLYFKRNGVAKFIIDPNGQVGIGNNVCTAYNPTSVNFHLSVDGMARFKRVRVDAGSWCDYVFEDNYKLISISDLEKYIKVNKHLPEIATTEEAQRDGVFVDEMQEKLLKKVEELTLYIIELKNEIEIIKKR